MGKLVAVGNLKGGTGKSTIAVNLACALVDAERTVVLVDADSQGTATDWLPAAACRCWSRHCRLAFRATRRRGSSGFWR
jgi:chromosome partitioning protein